MSHTISLEWKEFNLDLNKVDAWCKANLADCCGISANSQLEVHFDAQPSEDTVAELQLHWESLDESSEEASSYKSKDDLKAEKEAKRESAKSKLAALGLDADELKAILG